MLYRIPVRIRPEMTGPHSESSGFFILIPPPFLKPGGYSSTFRRCQQRRIPIGDAGRIVSYTVRILAPPPKCATRASSGGEAAGRDSHYRFCLAHVIGTP